MILDDKIKATVESLNDLVSFTIANKDIVTLDEFKKIDSIVSSYSTAINDLLINKEKDIEKENYALIKNKVDTVISKLIHSIRVNPIRKRNGSYDITLIRNQLENCYWVLHTLNKYNLIKKFNIDLYLYLKNYSHELENILYNESLRLDDYSDRILFKI